MANRKSFLIVNHLPLITVKPRTMDEQLKLYQSNNRKCIHQDSTLDCYIPNEIPECYEDCKFYKPKKMSSYENCL